MPWIESHQDLRNHPKTARFRRRLGVSLPTAIGHLHMLWWWSLSYAEDGKLGRHDDDVIAEAGGWESESLVFVEALVVAGFLDEDRTIHDWDHYTGRLQEKREANRVRQQRWREKNAPPASENDQKVSTNGVVTRDESVSNALNQPTNQPDQPDQPVTNQPTKPTGKNPSQTLPLRGKGSAGAGPISRDVVDRLSTLPPDLAAASFHAAAELALSELGFTCEREVSVDDRGDGYGGRVDLVAQRGDERIAFEFDRATPRVKSIRKLAQMSGALRVVVLREPFARATPNGLDAVIGNALAPIRPEQPNGRPMVPTDASAYLSGPYGAIVAERMKAQQTAEEAARDPP